MNNDVRGRIRLSMDKDWRFHLGDVEIPEAKGHNDVYSMTKAGGARGPAQSDWNDNAWQKIDVPHDWVVGLDFDSSERANHGYKHRGIGWYRKCFFLDENDKGKQLLLEFDGIATHATIYFNGSIIERNWSGYTSFAVDISDRAFYGNRSNTLAVKVDSTCFEGWWYEGAGIYRHVWLTKKAPVHIAHWGTWVNPQRRENQNWETQIETTIENSFYENGEFILVSLLFDSEGNCVGKAETESICDSGEQKVINQSIMLNNPRLWDVDSPNLYKLVSEVYQDGILVDRDETIYGYRTIRFCADTGFYLNDRPLKIKGTCNHQDHAGVGVALPDSIHEYRIRRLKEMGSNAYRCAHNNPAKELLDACDRLGMLVMDENRNFESSTEVIRQVETMVRRDRNHPCVIMYSIFNEEPHQGTPQGRAMARRLKHVIKRLDGTRPVIGALNGGVMENEGTADVLDITGINYQLGIFDAFHKKHPHQPIVSSESVSALSTRGVYLTDKEKHEISSYDEEKAPWGATIRDTWKAVNTRDFVMGMFTWTGFDYRGEPTPFTWPSVSTFFGAMDTCGFAKDAYYMHQACWKDEPMIHIVPHWNWEGMEGKPVRIMSHTNCDEAELFLNGKSLGRKPTPIYEQAFWEVPYEAGRLVMKGYKNGIEVAEDIVETAGEVVSLRIEADRDYIFGDGQDAIPVNVLAVDSEGRFNPTAGHKVKFFISGPGKILGVGNGDPNCHEADIASERSLFNGKCQAVVQSVVGTGTLTIRAEAEGLIPAEIAVDVKYKLPLETVHSSEEVHLSNWRMTSEIFMERPDPNMEIGDSDMNTWEPVDINNGPQSKFNNYPGGYALYRTRFTIPADGEEGEFVLFFYSVMGYAEIYLGKEKVAEKDDFRRRELEVPLKGKKGEEVSVTVLIQCSNASKPEAGICRPVVLRTRNRHSAPTKQKSS